MEKERLREFIRSGKAGASKELADAAEKFIFDILMLVLTMGLGCFVANKGINPIFKRIAMGAEAMTLLGRRMLA